MLRLLRRLISLSVKLVLLVVGIGALIAYANLSDLEGWKAEIKDRMVRVAGRRLYIDGPMDFELGLPPRIIARGIRLENAPWGKKRYMLKAQALIAEIDLLPLMLGDVAVPRLQLVGADILVEVRRDGLTNWDELNSFDTAAGGASTGGFNFPLLGPAVNGGVISVSGGTVTVSNTATGTSTTFRLPGGDGGLSGNGGWQSASNSGGGRTQFALASSRPDSSTSSGGVSNGSGNAGEAQRAPKCVD